VTFHLKKREKGFSKPWQGQGPNTNRKYGVALKKKGFKKENDTDVVVMKGGGEEKLGF